MKEITQSILHGDPTGIPGNCLQAAVASLFDLELEDVPHFIAGSEIEPSLWQFALTGWALARGYRVEIRYVHPRAEQADVTLPQFGVACGPSERGVSHAVVSDGGRVVWDPHPTRAGLLRVKSTIAFVRIDERFEPGTRVRIDAPGVSANHGRRGVVVEAGEGCYSVRLDGESDTWLFGASAVGLDRQAAS